MRAFIFPGQGAQVIGMGRDIAAAYPSAQAVFDEVDEALGEKLSALIWDGDVETLTLTENAQPALMATSIATMRALEAEGVPVFAGAKGFTNSHQFAVLAEPFGGGQAASKKLRQNGFLACGIGLPVAMVDGDMNGLRIGTPELVRRGMTTADMAPLAALIARALRGEPVGDEVASWRRGFKKLCFVH